MFFPAVSEHGRSSVGRGVSTILGIVTCAKGVKQAWSCPMRSLLAFVICLMLISGIASAQDCGPFLWHCQRPAQPYTQPPVTNEPRPNPRAWMRLSSSSNLPASGSRLPAHARPTQTPATRARPCPTRLPRGRAPSSSTCKTTSFISWREAGARSATASALADKASPGLASRLSTTSRNGQIGTHPEK